MTIDINKVKFSPPYFSAYNAPNGWLFKDTECHALWYYYLLAYKRLEYNRGDILEYEDSPADNKSEEHFANIFRSIFIAYKIEPARMVHYWEAVDMQCALLDMPVLPEKYRFKGMHVVK